METTATAPDLVSLLTEGTLDDERLATIKEHAFESKESINRFREALSEVEQQADSDAGKALMAGACQLLMGRIEKAIGWLEKASDGGLKHLMLGSAYREQKRYDDAIAQFEKAANSGVDKIKAASLVADCQRLAGNIDAAEQKLNELQSAGEDSPDWHYLRGMILHSRGDHEDAIAALERALDLDHHHARVCFSLANMLYLYGDDEGARDLYEDMLNEGNGYVNALMNLAIIHEDAGEYQRAVGYLRRVLAIVPDHPRANLYLRDVEAGHDMFIDEQEMMDSNKRNAVLEIPVSDFELSVRSRNCLKKMNIHTLGDLLRTTETELLAYKNFGETSLKEIKAMLLQKGLTLGQLAHERRKPSFSAPTGASPVASNASMMGPAPTAAAAEAHTASIPPEVFNRPVSTMSLSVRSRKCLQVLGINTIGELASRTENELMSSRNFGQTSLNEIKASLTEIGVSLRPNAE